MTKEQIILMNEKLSEEEIAEMFEQGWPLQAIYDLALDSADVK